MATFFGRRYRRARVGGLEKALGAFFLLVTVGIVLGFVSQFFRPASQSAVAGVAAERASEPGAGESAGSAPAVAEVPSPLPSEASAGWQAPKQASRYTPENLYIKIDGRADIYLQYRVVSLTFGSYANATDAKRTIDVYWYDMGKPENAQGIYRAEAPPDAEKAGLGQESYLAGGAVFFVKGSSYVQVLPSGPDPADGEAAMVIAKGIAASITEEGGDQWASKLLPGEGRIEGSLEFLANDVFDLDFLHDVYTAWYQTDAGGLRLFIHRADSGQAAADLLKRYEAFFREYGEVVWRDADPAKQIIAGDVAGEIDVVFIRGQYLGGVSGADDLEAAKKAAKDFFEGLAERLKDEG
jgi:hypothetical protein